MKFSKVQLEFLANANHGVHLSWGSVRSGKTFIQIYAFIAFLVGETSRPRIPCLITAKKRDSVERNIFQPMKEILGGEPEIEPFFEFKTQPFRVFFRPKEIECYCEGANDEGAEGKIRGMTTQAWLGDEVTLYPENVFNQCLTRLSAGARLGLLTCNPDRLTHYIHTKYISTNRVKTYSFSLKDNHTLPEDYLELLKQTYTGIHYTRFIEGQWGGSEEDMVLPEFYQNQDTIVCEYSELPSDFRPMVALDVGWRDWTFSVLGHYNFMEGRVYIDNEYVIKRNMNTDMFAKGQREIEEATWGRPAIRRWSDTDLRLIEDLNVIHGLSFIPTRKDNKDAQINALRVLIKNDRLRIHKRCSNLISQCNGASWDKSRKERTYARTEEHGHYDGVDALTYFIRNIDSANPFPDRSIGWARDGKFISPKYQQEIEQWNNFQPTIKHVTDTTSESKGKAAYRPRSVSRLRVGRW